MGSWRDYAVPVTDQAPTQTGSWRDHAKVVDQPTEIPDEQIIQEQHPSISRLERMQLQNLGNDEGKANFFKSKGLEAHQQNGQWLVRAPGEQKYKVLDPNTGFFSKDMLNDATDIMYDVPDAALTAGATVLGGIGGTAVAPGAGTIAGGMAAGGAAGVASEALRQKLGSLSGLDQNLDKTDVAISGGAGALSPLLFGVGAEGKELAQAAMKNQAKKAAGMDAITQAVKKNAPEAWAKSFANQGVLGTTADYVGDKVLPKAAGALSGVGTEGINKLRKYIDYVKANNTDAKMADEGENVLAKFRSGFDSKQRETGQALQGAMDNAGAKTNISEAKQAFQDRIGQLEQKVANGDTSPQVQSEIDSLKSEYTHYFGADDKELANELPASVAWDKDKQLTELANYSPVTGLRAPRGRPPGFEAQGAARDAKSAIRKQLDTVTDGESTRLKGEYGNLVGLEKQLEPAMRNEKSLFSTARGLDNDSHTLTRAYLKKAEDMGVNGAEDVAKYSTAAQWYKPKFSLGSRESIAGAALPIAGFYLGSNSDLGHGGGTVGAGLGALAALPFSKRGVKAVISGNHTLKEAAKNLNEKMAKAYLNQGKRSVLGKAGIYDYLADKFKEQNPDKAK